MNVFIVGLGQIGGSIGLNLVKGRQIGRVSGYDRDRRQSLLAKRDKGIHSIASTIKLGLAQADLVILAIPTSQIVGLLPRILRYTSDRSAILDVGSSKAEILNVVNKCPRKINFVGGHPLAGTEGHGFASANSDIFAGAHFALIPTPGTSRNWIAAIKRLVVGLGARPMMMSAEQHDRLIAITSGLPYLISLGLMNLAISISRREPEIWNLTAGSFRSATRVAASSPTLTRDILLTNKDCVLNAMDRFIAELSAQREMISGEKNESLRQMISKANKAAVKIRNGKSS